MRWLVNKTPIIENILFAILYIGHPLYGNRLHSNMNIIHKIITKIFVSFLKAWRIDVRLIVIMSYDFTPQDNISMYIVSLDNRSF